MADSKESNAQEPQSPQSKGKTPFVFPVRSLVNVQSPSQSSSQPFVPITPSTSSQLVPVVVDDLATSLKKEAARRRADPLGMIPFFPPLSPSQETGSVASGSPGRFRSSAIFPSPSPGSPGSLSLSRFPFPNTPAHSRSSTQEPSTSATAPKKPTPVTLGSLDSSDDIRADTSTGTRSENETGSFHTAVEMPVPVENALEESIYQTDLPEINNSVLPAPPAELESEGATVMAQTAESVAASVSDGDGAGSITSITDFVRLPPLHDQSQEQITTDIPSSDTTYHQDGTLAVDGTTGQSGTGSAQEIPVTVRFKYVQDENGHHHVMGREGTLYRCEDEPIHMPGAVQSYGVIIVVEEDFFGGRLIVRQVSENVHRILGLGIPYLFNLECFSDTFPFDQAELLWRNIAFLEDPNGEGGDDGTSTSDQTGMDTPDASASDQTPKQKRRKEYEGPEVFTITGWAEPQTEDENEDRIPWRCWCAAHRPSLKHVPRPSAPPTSASSMATGENERDGTEARSTHSSNSGSGIGANGGPPRLIVFEFELETDTENPLYPAPSFVSPGDGSPASGSRTSDFTRPEFSTATQSGGAGTGTPSGGTVTQQNDGNVIPNEATELAQLPPATPLTNAALQTLADETDTGPQGKELIIPSAEQEFTSPFTKDGRPPSNSSLSRGDSAKASNVASGRGSGRVGSNDGLGQIGQPGGLSGDNTWMPSLQDIHESTTSKSKPLKSLEKLRIGGFSRRMSSLSGSGGMSGRNSGGRMSRNSNISGRAGSSSRLDSPALLNQRDSGAQGRSSGGGKSKKSSGGTGGRTGGFHSSRSSMSNAATVSTMDVFAVLSEVMDQLNEANSLDIFLKVVVGVIKDLTQFHRVLVYQFDDSWNGQVVAELLDWAASHDLYMGLHFPASDIPPQARQLYLINKVRSLYDRDQPTSRMVARDFTDLEYPLDMTHCYLRAMSPIHLKYLGNMGVRASMSISITAFGQLWGLIACHSYGTDGMRVSFPVRQMLRLLSDAIGRNIERLSYAHRLTTRKLISTIPTEKHPTGYIMSNAEDLLSLFDADYGILVIGDGAKILGPNDHGREILIIAQYFRVKKSNLLQSTPSIKKSLPDLELPSGMDIIAGLLYVPLSSEGKDFLVLLRRGQMRDVIWAGKPHKQGDEGTSFLEPRKSFQAWGETVVGRCRSWTDEQVETAGVLALVYGKFIEVWREKETAVRNTKLANLLLTNASHEVRTPLNQIIGFLEMALEGPLDEETRKNLQTTHMASKSLLFTINDLLDLTKLETGYTTSFNEPFDLPALVEESVAAYRRDALSRGLYFDVEIGDCPRFVLGDRKKVSTIIANVTNNAVRYTKQGGVNILCKTFLEPEGLRTDVAAVEILISDTGIGIPSPKLEEIFQQFEQVEDSNRPVPKTTGLGLGLAVVARIVEQLKGQIRVESSETGSRFSLLLPFDLPGPYHSTSPDNSARLSGSSSIAPHTSPSEVESFVSAVSATHMPNVHYDRSPRSSKSKQKEGIWEVQDSATPIRSVKMDETYFDRKPRDPTAVARALAMERARSSGISHQIEDNAHIPREPGQLRVLVAEDDKVNARLIVKRLQREGHIVELAENGQEAYDKIKTDFDFDCILMDIQMPIMNGFEATGAIRHFEASTLPPHFLPAHELNGRIPIFAVTASLESTQRDDLYDLGIDGWILKPINWSRVSDILVGVTDIERRRKDMYTPEKKWENGGWLHWFAGNGPL